jgi:hypothetical protein
MKETVKDLVTITQFAKKTRQPRSTVSMRIKRHTDAYGFDEPIEFEHQGKIIKAKVVFIGDVQVLKLL